MRATETLRDFPTAIVQIRSARRLVHSAAICLNKLDTEPAPFAALVKSGDVCRQRWRCCPPSGYPASHSHPNGGEGVLPVLCLENLPRRMQDQSPGRKAPSRCLDDRAGATLPDLLDLIQHSTQTQNQVKFELHRTRRGLRVERKSHPITPLNSRRDLNGQPCHNK